MMPELTTFRDPLPRDIEEALNSFAPFIGLELNQAYQELGRTFHPNTRSKKSLLCKAILNSRPARVATAFTRYGHELRTVTVDVAGQSNETLSMGRVEYVHLLDEEWDAAPRSTKYPQIKSSLETTRFCFVVFKESAGGLVTLDRVTTPRSLDWALIEPEVKRIWQRTKQTIHDGRPLQSNGRFDFQWARQTETAFIHIRTAGQSGETKPTPHNGPQPVLGYYVNKAYVEDVISSTLVFLPLSDIEDNGVSNLSERDLQYGHFPEGHIEQVLVNRYERNKKARQACLKHWGYECQVCGMDFAARYGEIGRRFIHVHHQIPLAGIGEGYLVDPILDLKPVCPNCHAMLHRETPPIPMDKLREQLQLAEFDNDDTKDLG